MTARWHFTQWRWVARVYGMAVYDYFPFIEMSVFFTLNTIQLPPYSLAIRVNGGERNNALNHGVIVISLWQCRDPAQ